jgi:hypothetical protein
VEDAPGDGEVRDAMQQMRLVEVRAQAAPAQRLGNARILPAPRIAPLRPPSPSLARAHMRDSWRISCGAAQPLSAGAREWEGER